MGEGRAAPVLGALLVSIAWFALGPEPALGKDESKDDRVVCIPAEDGRTWNCGTPDSPPEVRKPEPKPEARSPASPAPPPFLMDPSRRPGPVYQGPVIAPTPARAGRTPPPDLPTPNRPAREPAAPIVTEPPAAEPAKPAPPASEPVAPPPVTLAPSAASATTSPASEPEPAQPAAVTEAAAAEPVPPSAPGPIEEPAPVAPEPVPEPAAATSPAPVEATPTATPPKPEPARKPPQREPMPVEPEVKPAEPEARPAEPETKSAEPEARPAEPETKSAEPEAPVAAAEAKPATAAGVGTIRGVAAFAGLDPARYTVQLARAARPDAFEALATELGVARGELYAVPWDQAGQRTWLLFWGEFADENAARAAVARLAGAERLVGAWPRRIRAMQDELRRSGARDRQP